MPLTDHTLAARVAALNAAIQMHAHLGLTLLPGVDRDVTITAAELAIRRTGDVFAAWINGTTRLRLAAGPIVDETTGAPTGNTNQGETMQINTGQKFPVTADTEDAAGYDTPESITWSIDNPEVASLEVSEDTHTCWVISGAPGSAVLTASIPGLELAATLAVDVVPAGTATITLVAGDAVEE